MWIHNMVSDEFQKVGRYMCGYFRFSKLYHILPRYNVNIVEMDVIYIYTFNIIRDLSTNITTKDNKVDFSSIEAYSIQFYVIRFTYVNLET